ncbi:MAG: hypothetical protein Crog4KO_30620 [Crocinitomicaceae bacterium]
MGRMKQMALLPFLSLLLIQCTSSNSEKLDRERLEVERFLEEAENRPNSISEKNDTFDYADTLIQQFISAHYTESDVHDDSVSIAFLCEGMSTYREQSYLCYRIGLDLGFRFQTDYHIYIDTARKQLFRDNLISEELETWSPGDPALKRYQ